MTDALFDPAPARPVWLITLADLALLLVGFFVLLQAHRAEERPALGQGIAAAFGAAPTPDETPVAVAAERVAFAPGSADLPAAPTGVLAWALDAARDPRVTLNVAGATDGSPADRDPASGSAMLLAADRARSLAAALAAAGVPGDRIAISTASPAAHARAATVTLAFTGEERTAR